MGRRLGEHVKRYKVPKHFAIRTSNDHLRGRPIHVYSENHVPAEPAQVSDSAQLKAATKPTPDGVPAHSFPTLLGDLSNLALNRVVLPPPSTRPPSLSPPSPPTSRARS